MEWMVWASLIGVLYSYFVYPAMLMLIPRRSAALRLGGREGMPVSLVITAYNEGKRIRQKIENSLALDYPAGQIEIIVASDCSSDDTDSIVNEYADRGVRLVRPEERKGKENAQLSAIRAARSDVIVFSDVATILQPDAINRIVRYFGDPRVGAVSSEDVFLTEDGKVVGEGLYVKYEMWLRRLESERNSLVGLSGSFFAARKRICTDWNIEVPSDFNTAINCIKQGYLAVTAPDVHGYYKNIQDEKKEYGRKLRTVIRGIAALSNNLDVLNPGRYGVFSFQVISHKVMRWLVPWFMAVLLVSSFALAREQQAFTLLVSLQVLFYVMAVGGYLSRQLRESAWFRIPYFFMQVNLAIAHAGLAYLFGTRMTVWEPSRR